MKAYISELIKKAIDSIDKSGKLAITDFDLSEPKTGDGDFATNAAFLLAKEFKSSPGDVAINLAKLIANADRSQKNALKEAQAVSGFVNFFLKPDILAAEINSMQKEITLEQFGAGKKIVFEYSSPNTNKPLHIGHTRNDVYGMACINLLKAIGHEVVSCEVINDRGIHIMKSILMYKLHGNGATPESADLKPDHFVGKFYVMFGQELEKDPTLNEQAQELLKKWESGDQESKELWYKMNQWFYEGAQETYQKEGSTFDHIDHESEIYEHGREIVQEGVKKGVFQTEEDGSVFVDLTEKGLDKKYLLRKDGTSIYITQDIYLWKLRAEMFSANQLIVTTSAEQAYHFQVLKEIFKLLDYPWAESFKHLPYEHVYLGKSKMSSRAGNAVSADELLEEVKKRVRATMLESQRIKGSVEDNELVEDIAFAAIKYGYLKYDTNTKIYFDMEETVAIEGNTGPYIQYAYARIRSILDKAVGTTFAVGAGDPLAKTGSMENLSEDSEIALAKLLLHYSEAVDVAAKEFKPSLLCAYLHELASKFNTMYDQVPVLNAESEAMKIARLSLLSAAASVLSHGLELLGIKAPEKL